MEKINKHYKNVKTVIRKSNPVDPYFISKYSFSPYMACQHACKYCDGRAEKYYVEGDYEKDIVVRKNLPEILMEQLPKLREKGIISIGSGISDPYQQVEKDEKIISKSLEILSNFNFAVSILTKSSLIQRDIDILEKINSSTGVTLMMSITTLDDEIRKTFEPYASSVEERIATLKMFKKRGIKVGALTMPFLPMISDSEKSILELVSRLKNEGIDFIMPGSLTLRPGIQKQTYLEIIEQNYPQFLKQYNYLYSNKLRSGNPVVSYRKEIGAKFNGILDQFDIPQMIPHRIYRDLLSIPDEIFVLLDHMIFLYRLKKINTSRLEICFQDYADWLQTKRKYFMRRKNLPENFITASLMDSIETGELSKVISNSKLYKFILEVVEERRIFNYINLMFD